MQTNVAIVHDGPIAEYHDREAWLAARNNYITATRAAAILGVHPYKGPADVQREVLHGPDDATDSPILRRGRMLEPVAVELWEEETGRKARRVPFRVSRDVPLIACSADRQALADDEHPTRPLEVKTLQWRGFERIRRTGLDDYMNVQGQVQSFVHRADATEWAVLHPDSFRLLAFTIEADPAFQERMVETLLDWWHRHIVNREPVAVTEPAPELELPEVSGEIRMVDGELAQALADIAEAKEVRDEAERFYGMLKDRFKEELELGVYESTDGVRLYHAQRGGSERFIMTRAEAAQLIDPVKLQTALVREFGERCALDLLREIGDEVKVDPADYTKRGAAYREIRVYRVTPAVQAF